jgi:replication-associated recombination protein RarA
MDIKKIIQNQQVERYRSFVLYGPPQFGKTNMAQGLAKRFNGEYIDLLQKFTQDVNLKSSIDTFGPEELKKWLYNMNVNKPLIVIDNMDFLYNTWDDNQIDRFLNFVEKDESRKCFCFVLQKRKIFKNRIILNSKNESRLIDIFKVKVEVC